MSTKTIKSKKQEIFEEAAKLFQEKGYSSASMRDLAQRVNLKVSSLYSHIGGKEEILQKICFDNANHFLEGISEVEALNLSPTESVKKLVRLHIKIALEDPTSITVFNDEWRHLSEPYLADFLKMRKDYETRFGNIIRKGIDLGEFKNLNITVVLFTILTSVRWLHYWHSDSSNLSIQDLERNILAILISGIQID
jgi:AcrR family transcriptional regulator